MLYKNSQPPPESNTPCESLTPYRIQLRNGYYAIIDREDLAFLSRWTWQLKKSSCCCYATTKIVKGGVQRTVLMHRLIMHAQFGYQVHHKNRNTLDNRKSNLVVCLPYEHKLLQIYAG